MRSIQITKPYIDAWRERNAQIHPKIMDFEPLKSNETKNPLLNDLVRLGWFSINSEGILKTKDHYSCKGENFLYICSPKNRFVFGCQNCIIDISSIYEMHFGNKQMFLCEKDESIDSIKYIFNKKIADLLIHNINYYLDGNYENVMQFCTNAQLDTNNYQYETHEHFHSFNERFKRTFLNKPFEDDRRKLIIFYLNLEGFNISYKSSTISYTIGSNRVSNDEGYFFKKYPYTCLELKNMIYIKELEIQKRKELDDMQKRKCFLLHDYTRLYKGKKFVPNPLGLSSYSDYSCEQLENMIKEEIKKRNELNKIPKHLYYKDVLLYKYASLCGAVIKRCNSHTQHNSYHYLYIPLINGQVVKKCINYTFYEKNNNRSITTLEGLIEEKLYLIK